MFVELFNVGGDLVHSRLAGSGPLAYPEKSADKTGVSVTGQVKNGVVVLPPGTMLPEVAEVTVQTVPANDSLAASIEKLAKAREHLPKDYTLNHGHCIGGEAAVVCRSGVSSGHQSPRNSAGLG